MATTKPVKSSKKPAAKPAAKASEKPQKAAKHEAAPIVPDQDTGDTHGTGHS